MFLSNGTYSDYADIRHLQMVFLLGVGPVQVGPAQHLVYLKVYYDHYLTYF